MDSIITKKLDKLLKDAPAIPISARDRLLILSDMHLGDGSSRDDFLSNSEMVTAFLEKYYLKKKFALVLNGDIEELHRYTLNAIYQRWSSVYDLFDRFRKLTALYKITGNHDHPLIDHGQNRFAADLYTAVRFVYKGKSILTYHGHQASPVIERLYGIAGFVLRYLATPLGIKNYTVAHDSTKKFKLERRIYEFSRKNRIISIIGHTHRPLFESMSKVDSLKYKIEKLCRKYPKAMAKEQETIRRKIDVYRKEFADMDRNEKSMECQPGGIYHDELLVPSLFNSGCAIGKRGVTALEIRDGKIALVHWFNRTISDKYLNFNGYEPERLPGTDYYRVIIKEEYLDYVTARLELLA